MYDCEEGDLPATSTHPAQVAPPAAWATVEGAAGICDNALKLAVSSPVRLPRFCLPVLSSLATVCF